ncbi:MAG: histidinol-phosphate aminotransferase [Sphingobacteriales bacterium]|jgi:histidinol-phosphate aminotransferase
MIAPEVLQKLENFAPYVCARHETEGEDLIFLDANESPWDTEINRYPDPEMRELRNRIGELKGIDPKCIMVGNGSDELIDMMLRGFSLPNRTKVFIPKPTYSMYQTLAVLNNLPVVEIGLEPNFEADEQKFLNELTGKEGILFLCRPNNPTANNISRNLILKISKVFIGPVIVDEAYIDFCPEDTFIPEIENADNLFVLQTFSKGWGMAGIRLGMLFGTSKNMALLNRIKLPYNVNSLTGKTALLSLQNEEKVTKQIAQIIDERKKLESALAKLSFVEKVYPSSANFILVRCKSPKQILQKLKAAKVVIRDRSSLLHCEGCLRISIGTPDQNYKLRLALENIENEEVINNR